MRVALLSKEFPPRLSGIADHTDHLATELARRAHDVTVVCADPAEHRAPYTVRALTGWPEGVVDAVHAVHPDVVVWQYNPFSAGRRGIPTHALRSARALSSVAPVVAFLHELWFPWGRAGLRGLVWAVAQRAGTRAVLTASARWIVTTGSRARDLARIDASKVRQIPVGTNVLPVDAPDARAALGFAADAFVLAHLGGTGPGKDLRPVFDAVRSVRARGVDAHLLLAGDTGPIAIPPDLQAAVHRTGVVPREALSRALRAADAYVHADPIGPSAGRRTSLVAALAHALPVIAYRGPDAAAELVDGRNVVLVDRDSGAVAGAIEALARDPGRTRQIGQAALETYRASFSWERIGDRVVAVCEEVTR